MNCITKKSPLTLFEALADQLLRPLGIFPWMIPHRILDISSLVKFISCRLSYRHIWVGIKKKKTKLTETNYPKKTNSVSSLWNFWMNGLEPHFFTHLRGDVLLTHQWVFTFSPTVAFGWWQDVKDSRATNQNFYVWGCP